MFHNRFGREVLLTNVVKGAKKRVFVAFDLQLLSHARPVRRVQRILVEPLDVEAQAAECKKDAVKLSHQCLLLGRIMAWIPLFRC
jgi:hypothetical protein